MYLNIIYVSEIDGELYNHNIKFPEVTHSRSLDHHWKQFKNDLSIDCRNKTFIRSIENVKWWKHRNKISNGEKTFIHRYGTRYVEIPYVEVAKIEMVKVEVRQKWIRVINTFDIKLQPKCQDPFHLEISEIQKFKIEDKVKLYTDAGTNIYNGESACGIIMKTNSHEVKIKAKLPTLDPKGATTAEHLSIALGLNLFKKAGLTEVKILTINDNQEAVKTVNGRPSFKDLVNKHGWGKYQVWKESNSFNMLTAEWSGSSCIRTVEEQEEVDLQIQRCHDIAHETMINKSFNVGDLSLQIDDRIETDKIGTSMRKLIGRKYVKNLLQTKYKSERHLVYLNERRTAIKKSSMYLAKTANGLNCYGDMAKMRGKMTARCPICSQQENWLHVIKCGSTSEQRNQFVHDIKDVKFEEKDRNDRF